jgi:hypothetical protein
MTDLLLADLAQISSLRVISRTSVMQLKGTKKSLPEIARQLNVDGVVEGSVLRSGDKARITAELGDAVTERHLWVRTYVRNVSDLLTLESEVARAIAGEIQARITPQESGRLSVDKAPPRIRNPHGRDRASRKFGLALSGRLNQPHLPHQVLKFRFLPDGVEP